MRLVVFGEYDFTLVAKLFSDQLLHPNFLFYPEGDGFEKGLNARRRTRQISMQDAIKLDERLFVKGDKINSLDVNVSFAQAIIDRKFRKGGIVFLSGETFFLGRGDDPALPHQTGRAVVVKSGDP